MKGLRRRLDVLEMLFHRQGDGKILDTLLAAMEGDQEAIADVEAMRRAGMTPLIEIYDAVRSVETEEREEDDASAG